MRPQRDLTIGSALIGAARPFFPAAAPQQPDDDRHPANCACCACTDQLLAAIRQPLVPPGVRVDPALDRRRRR